MKYSTGLRRDPPHVVARNAIRGTRRLGARLGSAWDGKPIDLSIWSPLAMDQGASSACTSHAFSSASYVSLKGGLPFVPSQLDIYQLERCFERASPDVPLEDSGAAISDGVLVLQEWGVRPMGPLPADGRFSDVTPENVNTEPKLGALEADAHTLLVGAHPITSEGDDLIADSMDSLAAGAPIVLAVPGGSDGFQSYESGVLGPVVGELDHCVYVLGGDGNTFRIRNSWSASWGQGGDVIVSAAFIKRCTGDRYALQVRKAA